MELFTASNWRLPPGFRFHPTDVELFLHYLKRKLLGKKLEAKLIAEVDIYQFHPSDLKEMASLKKDMDLYFFCPRGKKYGSGDRTNRATQSGYWKGTGKDKPVSYKERIVGKVKTLVFHLGKPPKGERTDWVMHEYRLEECELGNKGCSDAFVLCKIFKKGGWGPRTGEQYGAPYNEEEWDQSDSGVTNADVVVNGLVSVTEQAGYGYADGYVSGVDEVFTPTFDESNVASTSMCAVVNEFVDRMAYGIPKAAGDITANSQDLVVTNVDDMWCADDFGIYDSLVNVSKPEQGGSGSGDGSVSGVHQAPSSTSDDFNVALATKGVAVNKVVDKMADGIPIAAADMWCAADFGIYDSLGDVGKLNDIGMGMELDEVMELFDFYS